MEFLKQLREIIIKEKKGTGDKIVTDFNLSAGKIVLYINNFHHEFFTSFEELESYLKANKFI